MKPYFVELSVSAVVMAESEIDAMTQAECLSREIVRDNDLGASDATLIRSLEHLKRLDHLWDGGCVPYNHDGNERLKDLLPEEEPFRDTKTIDMFSSQP